MQIILLSGGSGKRLWPLSNEARSKQFLPLLERTDGCLSEATPQPANCQQPANPQQEQKGTMESMVQRVVRQIREAKLEAGITLATNATQRDIIVNQLGEEIDMVLEPERRDTFPAIALACSYLKLAKRLPDDETVVIMPCDPYTEAGYFSAIGKMAQCVRQDAAELVLMGIKPTYPSAKYGYVVPASGNDNDNENENDPSTGSGTNENENQTSLNSQRSTLNFQRVSRFTEKPDVATAEQLLKQGALWNGGVFAFRLGYMMNIVGKYMPVGNDGSTSSPQVNDNENDGSTSSPQVNENRIRDFETLRSRYSEFPKISFDYEVAEKAKSVAVVPFDGEWKDLGTWNTLTDELRQHTIGNAHLGPKAVNTHVINELSTPIFVDGLQDAVVAASPDGILVCAKRETENIKKYVDGLSDRPMYEERRWGSYRVIDSTTYSDGYKSLTKSITLRSGKNISYQIHAHRDEVWTFVDGEGLLLLDDRLIPVSRGYVANIKRGQKHAVKALTDLTFIEVQSGEELIEEDITRLQMEWPE